MNTENYLLKNYERTCERIATSSPALLKALVHNSEWMPIERLDRRWQEYSNTSTRVLAHKIGLSLRQIRKLDVFADRFHFKYTLSIYAKLIHLDTRLSRILKHLPSISISLLYNMDTIMDGDYSLWAWYGSLTEQNQHLISDDFIDVAIYIKSLYGHWPPGIIHGPSSFARWLTRLKAANYAPYKIDYPNPEIRQITSLQEIQHWGRREKNCLPTLADGIVQCRMYVFVIESLPTVSIVVQVILNESFLFDAREYDNKPLSSKRLELILAWCEANRINTSNWTNYNIP